MSFGLIVFGGFFLGPALDRTRGEMVAGSGYRGTFERAGGVRWVERERVAVPLHLPATSCYYQHNGLFSGCSLLFLSEHITELTPILHVMPFLLLLVAMMFAMGRLWCGWVCPFGALSDLLSWLRRLMGRDHAVLSRRARDALVWTKYALLGLALGISALAALPQLAAHKQSLIFPFCQVCIGRYVSPLLSGAQVCWTNLRDGFTGTLTVLGIALFVLFFAGVGIRRFYCRICPIGGLSAPFNRYGLLSLHKRDERCTRCGACARVCPVDNRVVYEARRTGPVDACECTLCMRCVEACPEDGCLRATWVGRTLARSGGNS